MSAGAAEFPHLHPSQHEMAQLSNEERIAWIRQERWIQYPRAKRILDRAAVNHQAWHAVVGWIIDQLGQNGHG